MKKVLLSILAVAALASCVQTEELQGIGGNNAIKFDNAYVGNATKAIDNSFDNSNLELFQVYGTLTDADGDVANIFDGVEVSKATGTWTYAEEHTKYWIAGNTYSFKAVAAGNEPGETNVVWDDEHLMPKAIEVLDASAQNDVLYAEVLGVNYVNSVQPVKFSFDHLLAKAKVTVKNVIPTNNGGYYVVNNVRLKGAHKGATYTIGAGWDGYNEAYNLPFGNIVATDEDAENAAAIKLGLDGVGASNHERLLIPQKNCDLTIVIDYAYFDKNGVEHMNIENKEIYTTANIEAGKAYNFVLALAEPGEKIEFDVENVNDWVEAVSSADALAAAIARGGKVSLGDNVILSETIMIAEGNEVELDLNGYALTIANAETTYAINNHGTLTLKDSKGTGSITARGIYNGYDVNGVHVPTAKLTVESGTYNAVGPNGGAAVYNYGIVEIKGGKFTSVGSYALNSQEGAKMTIYGGETVNGGIYLSGAELVIEGGQINNARSGCHTVYAWNSTVTVNGGGVHNDNSGNSALMFAGTSQGVINGGTYSIKDGRVPGNGNTWTSCLLDVNNSATLTINDGTFNGGFRVQAGTTCTINGGSFNDCTGSNYNIYGTAVVKGGIYTDNTAYNFAKKWVADGYTLVEKNGVWSVIVGATVSSSEALETAIADGATIVLTKGTYVLPVKSQKKTLKFIGSGDPTETVIATNTSGSYEGCNYNLQGSTVVFENVSITTDNKTYTGYAGCNATFNNCIINNSLTLYGDTTFNNCTLNVSGDQYNIWTWAAPHVTFNDCTINSDGKALLLYGGGNTVLTVNDCVFNDSGVLPDLKAAIEVGSDYGTSVFELIVNNTVVNGYEITDKGIPTGTTLWGNKNSMGQDKLNVIVDGVDVY